MSLSIFIINIYLFFSKFNLKVQTNKKERKNIKIWPLFFSLCGLSQLFLEYISLSGEIASFSPVFKASYQNHCLALPYGGADQTSVKSPESARILHNLRLCNQKFFFLGFYLLPIM